MERGGAKAESYLAVVGLGPVNRLRSRLVDARRSAIRRRGGGEKKGEKRERKEKGRREERKDRWCNRLCHQRSSWKLHHKHKRHLDFSKTKAALCRSPWPTLVHFQREKPGRGRGPDQVQVQGSGPRSRSPRVGKVSNGRTG
ncbi:hypothetical protein LX36DRAFT_208622 [Colletotrichum falcatum]|nr:hypothetical protein LX36DRAFT_208622 [Colletotrichum falcatum]